MIYRQIKSQSDCLKLQEDLEAAIKWEQDWLMSFHPDKCNIMNITTKRNPIHFYYNMHGHILESVYCSTRKISRCHNLNRPKMEHPHPTNCRQSKQIIMFYQKKSKSTITNNKRTSISNPNKTQIRILLHCLGSSHKRKHQLARKGTATGSQVYMQQTS